MEGEAYFLSDTGLFQYYMMVDYCFYRVKPTAVILCSYFPFSLVLCCDFNLIAFLYWLTTALIYAFVETLDLYIVGF